MRVRTAHVAVQKSKALPALFDLAVERHLAWVIGSGRVYSDLERVASKSGYRVWAPEEQAEGGDGLWLAVRDDLIKEDGWEAEPASLSFETTRKGLGRVTLVGDPLFVRRNTVKALRTDEESEFDGFVYAETLYSAEPLQN